MKNLIITLALTFSVLSVGAQGQYLYDGTSAKGSNVTYVCKHNRGVVTIYNANNVYEEVTPKRSDGVPTGIDDTVQVADQNTIYDIVSEVFSPAEQEWFLKNRKITIGYTVNPSSGDVMEVKFKFLDTSNWATIPPDKFYLFEQKIKQRMKFILSTNDRKYNIVKVLF